MSVTEYNYRFRNTLYHVQGYFGIIDQGAVVYAGYKNAFDTHEITLSEVEYLTEDMPSPLDPIPGDVNGFTNSQSIHYTKCHILGTDKTNYALGFAIIRVTSNLYRFTHYTWNKNNPTEWRPTFSISLSKTGVEPVSIAYNKLPAYVYLGMTKNITPGSSMYPYPNLGGMYYFNESSELQYIGSYYNDIIPLFWLIHNDTEVNPDPDPTPIPNDDPYSPGGIAWTGGGNGNFDPTTDDVGIPGLPALSATSTGFITLFNPSVAQLRNLANYMWSGLFDIDTFRKIFADPMDCILGLSIVPVNVPSGGSASVMVGNIDTGISMTTASAQYVEVDCGSVNVEENYGAYLDYEPYTKAELYLPYIGIHAISIDDIMDKTVTIKYHIDILSGACVAYVKCGSSVLYSFIGQCASSIPITGNDWTNVINGVLSIAGSIGSMVATGGANAPTQVANIASTAVNSMKPSIEKSGSLSGTGGMLGIQTPYLILTRPRQAIPAGQNRFIGYPAFITDFLGNVSGYTEVESIHLEGIQATGAELSEIETILKSGVIF